MTLTEMGAKIPPILIFLPRVIKERYDAMQAIVAGLARSTTRNGLQQALKDPNFATMGAGRPVSFLTFPTIFLKGKSGVNIAA